MRRASGPAGGPISSGLCTWFFSWKNTHIAERMFFGIAWGCVKDSNPTRASGIIFPLKMTIWAISSIWVCLKIGYIPNYTHLIGIMISKTIGFRGTLFSDKPILRRTNMALPYNINHAVGLLPGHPSVPSVNVLPLQRSIPSWKNNRRLVLNCGWVTILVPISFHTHPVLG